MNMSRREMLRMTALALGGAALAACGATPTPTPAPTATPIKVVETKVVEKPVTQVVTKVETKVVEKIVTATPVPVTPTPTLPKAKITGTFTVVQKKDYFPAMNDWLRNEMAKFFTAQGWSWEISYEAGYTGGTPFVEKLSAASAAGTPPDLMMHTDEMTNLQRLGVVDKVSDLVDYASKLWGSPSARQKNDMVFADKEWYYVPYFQRSDGGWYQEPVFKAKNIDPQKIRLYPDLWEACLAVSDPAKQMYGWGVTIARCGDGDWFRNRVFHGWGAYVQDETGDYVTINTPQMVDALTLLTSLYLDKKWANMLPPGVLSWNDASNNEAYLAGKLAYTQNGGTVYAKAIIDKNPIATITRFHPPAGGPVNKEFNSLSANYWCIFKKSKNQEAARITIKYFLGSVDMLDGIFSNAPAFALPAYEKLWDLSKYVKTNQVAMDQKPVATDPNGWMVPLQYPGPANNPPWAAANQQGVLADMIAAVLKGTSVKDAVKEAHDRYVKIWKEFGKPGEKK